MPPAAWSITVLADVAPGIEAFNGCEARVAKSAAQPMVLEKSGEPPSEIAQGPSTASSTIPAVSQEGCELTGSSPHE